MYVFLLAGSEVVLSALVLATCNFLFIKKKPSAPAETLDGVAVTDDTKIKACDKSADSEEEKELREEQEKETGKEKDEDKGEVVEDRPKSVTVDSQEVERFLKEPQQNGDMVVSPETCL